MKGKRSDLLVFVPLAVLIFGVLEYLPRLVGTEVDGLSAAADAGYDSGVAYLCAIAWALGVIAIGAWRQTRSTEDIDVEEAPASEPSVARARGVFQRLHWPELALVFAVFALAYFPLFLARYAPFSEDQFFFATLHRMAHGQVPYRDFAFLYGPLMVYAAHAWTELFGFSMVSFFAYLSLIEGLQFAVLMGVLQLVVPDRRRRWIVFLVLLPFLFNTLLGLNWSGTRRIASVFVALLACTRPYDRRAQVGVGLLAGLHLAYSHEYALGGLVGVLGMYGVGFLRGEGWRAVRAAATVGALATVVWIALTYALLGDATAAYVENAREVALKMSTGHANFPFRWTLNAAALFFLLAYACVALGRGFFRARGRELLAGDRLLVCGVLYAFVVLKSGFGRCDHWHMDAAFLVLIVAFLVRLPVAALAFDRAERAGSARFLAAVVITYLVGIAPDGSHYAAGYVKGARDVLTGTAPDPVDSHARTPSLEVERTHPRSGILAMGNLLARPDLADRPVFFHAGTWHLGPFVGVLRPDYPLDDLMYSADMRPREAYLRDNQDALVVIDRFDHARLFEGRTLPDAPELYWEDLSFTKRLCGWLATPHYLAKPGEERLKNRLNDERVGFYIRDHYEVLEDWGDYLVLAPTEAGTDAEGDAR